MTAQAATVAGFLEALEQALEQRAALADVLVSTMAPKDGVKGDAIILVSDTITEERRFRTSARDRETTVTVTGFVESRSVSKTAPSLTAAARAGELLDELEDEVVHGATTELTVGLQAPRRMLIERTEWLPSVLDAGGYAWRGYFELSYSARIG